MAVRFPDDRSPYCPPGSEGARNDPRDRDRSLYDPLGGTPSIAQPVFMENVELPRK
jgi:hypothetical protein